MLGQLDLSEAVGLDETVSRRGHRYVTVSLAIQRQQEPVTLVLGYGKAVIQLLSAFLTANGRHPVLYTEVVCNMSQDFLSGVGKHLPNAVVTVGWFHTVQTFTKALRCAEKPG
ncbi:transposase [Halomonas sp. M5N1S17]|uniref:transposase n=1 Tax=Halomonas alkalisoli TaxID=2907158 RepID=UPI001F43A356|nr:transposase [Halomonas alkalisoli]MCE9662541.1 transposase [Halomonas alkalisoli]